jgi:chemotaxis response regulator CheB
MTKRRIMIVSPYPLFREGLSRLLAESSDFELSAVVPSLVEAETKAVGFLPDVIVISQEDAIQPFLWRLLELARVQVIALTLDNKQAFVYRRHSVMLDTAQDLYQVLQSN